MRFEPLPGGEEGKTFTARRRPNGKKSAKEGSHRNPPK